MCSLKKNSDNNLNLLSKFKRSTFGSEAFKRPALAPRGLFSQFSLGRPLMINLKPFSNSTDSNPPGSGAELSAQKATKLHFVSLRFVGVGFRGYIIKKIIDVGASFGPPGGIKGLHMKYLLQTTDLQTTDFLDESVKR